MLELPSHPTALVLRAFVLSLALLLLGLAGLLSAVLPLQIVLMLVVSALAVAALGMARPALASLPYKAWNRLTRYFTACARIYVMAVCYVVIVAPVGRLSSTLSLGRPRNSQSMWVARRGVDRGAYQSLYGAGSAQGTQLFARAFVDWASNTSNLWACALLPMIHVLRWLEPQQEAEVSSDLYTLF